MTLNMSLYSQLINEYAPEPSNMHINVGIQELSNNNHTKKNNPKKPKKTIPPLTPASLKYHPTAPHPLPHPLHPFCSLVYLLDISDNQPASDYSN